MALVNSGIKGSTILMTVAIGLFGGCGGTDTGTSTTMGAKQLPAGAQSQVLDAMADVAGGCLGQRNAPRAVDQLLALYREHGGDRTIVVKGYATRTLEGELVEAATMLERCQPRLAAQIDRELERE